MKEEPVDVLDQKGNKTGKTVLKSVAHAKGLWHGAVHLWIYNSKGEILLQLRHPKKVIHPNTWDVSVAGHIPAGKDNLDCAVEEVQEELGLTINPADIEFIGEMTNDELMSGGWHHKIALWSYAIKLDNLDLSELKLEEAETSAVKWISLGTFAKELADPIKSKQYGPARQAYDLAIAKIPELLMQQEHELKTIQSYDQVAEKWTAAHQMHNGWKEELLHFHDKYLKSGSLIEVGCGSGRDAKILVDLGCDYIGVDASKGLLEIARKTVPKGNFKQLNLYDLHTIKQKYDGFMSIAVLLHIPRPKINKALQEIKSVLKPSAVGLIVMVDGEGELFEVRDVDGRHQERLFIYWNKDDFEKVLDDNGFKIEEYFYRHLGRSNWHGFYVKMVSDE